MQISLLRETPFVLQAAWAIPLQEPLMGFPESQMLQVLGARTEPKLGILKILATSPRKLLPWQLKK